MVAYPGKYLTGKSILTVRADSSIRTLSVPTTLEAPHIFFDNDVFSFSFSEWFLRAHLKNLESALIFSKWNWLRLPTQKLDGKDRRAAADSLCWWAGFIWICAGVFSSAPNVQNALLRRREDDHLRCCVRKWRPCGLTSKHSSWCLRGRNRQLGTSQRTPGDNDVSNVERCKLWSVTLSKAAPSPYGT